MMLTLPSFWAAATRAAMPPTSAADFAVAAFTVEAVLPPPQAVSRTRAPARRPSRLMAASPFIAFPPRAGRRRPESRTAAGEHIPCSPPQCRADLLPRLKHLRDRMSRSGGQAPPESVRRGRCGRLVVYCRLKHVGPVGGLAIVDLDEREDETGPHVRQSLILAKEVAEGTTSRRRQDLLPGDPGITGGQRRRRAGVASARRWNGVRLSQTRSPA